MRRRRTVSKTWPRLRRRAHWNSMGGSRLPTGFCRGSGDASQASGGTGRSMSMSALRASIRSRTGIVLSETFINALLAFVTYAVIVRITDLATVGLWALVSSLMAFARSVDVWSRGVSALVAQASVRGGGGTAANSGRAACREGVSQYV